MKQYIYDVNKAFTLGTVFPDIYKPYKDYTDYNPSILNKKEELMYHIIALELSINDLALYLDLNSEDTKYLEPYNMYVKKLNELIKLYESTYGSLSYFSDINSENYSYVKGNFPWEVENVEI